jgi:hypothetical protein
MTVQPLLSRRDSGIRRRRSGLTRHDAAHPSAEPRRRESQSQDNALYNCGCGFVFEAPVTTSVDCPHCGGYQAW